MLLAHVTQESCVFFQRLLLCPPAKQAVATFHYQDIVLPFTFKDCECLLLCKLWGRRAEWQTVIACWLMWQPCSGTKLTQMFLGIREKADCLVVRVSSWQEDCFHSPDPSWTGHWRLVHPHSLPGLCSVRNCCVAAVAAALTSAASAAPVSLSNS